MREKFGECRHVKIPLDGKLGAGVIWLVAIALLAHDSRDGHLGIEGAWALMFALAGAVVTTALLHAYSRRVVLEVMSWEHRQLANEDGNTALQVATPFRTPPSLD